MITHAAGRRILPHGRGAVAGSTRGEAHEEARGPIEQLVGLARETRVLEHRGGSGVVTDEYAAVPQEHVRLC